MATGKLVPKGKGNVKGKLVLKKKVQPDKKARTNRYV
jgi:hypothetical protein